MPKAARNPRCQCSARWWRALALAVVAVLQAAAAAGQGFVCAQKALSASARTSSARPAASLSPRGQVHALVLFARFADEAGFDAVPDFAANLFDVDRPGSLSHFFREMSRGQFALDGQILPRVYTSRGPTAEYLSGSAGRAGAFGRFSREILLAADEDVDFSGFDNDGPDGVANSGDDDGFVDLVLLITASTPTGFIVGDADGIALLGLENGFTTADPSVAGGRISVRSDFAEPAGGTLQRGRSLADAVGIAAHEMGHILGLPDLYDTEVNSQGGALEPLLDSAGIGSWGLMGHGATGWDDRGGPTPFCAWSLMQLGWLGRDNEQLVVVTEELRDAFIGDVHQGGDVYQVPLSGQEYLLVEHRRRDGSYYDRDLPAEGVLIWRVSEGRLHNNDEAAKLVDLVCADGGYADAGFPLGQEPDPDLGRDNLDFWSHDEAYRLAHGGNLGDATDPFDGEVYTELTPVSNPAINRVSVNRIRRVGNGMAADIAIADRRRAGLLEEVNAWRDTIDIVGDVILQAESRLIIAPGTVVRVGPDQRRRGADEQRSELIIAGSLITTGPRPVRFTSAAAAPAPGDWAGVLVTRTGQAQLAAVVIEHAVDGLVISEASKNQDLFQVSVRGAANRGIATGSAAARVLLREVEVEAAGGAGLVLEGGGPVEVRSATVRDCGGDGLVRRDGRLTLLDADLTGNGAAGDGVDLLLGDRVSGTVTDCRLAGAGVGVRCQVSDAVVLEGNTLTGYRVAVRARSSNPRIVGNVFRGVDTVLAVEGFRVPMQVQLNVVEGARTLVANQTAERLDAARNWWGTADEVRIQAGMSGPVTWLPALNYDPRLPVAFALAQNYPNPFNGQTAIEFSVSVLQIALSSSEALTLDVRTVTGGQVRRLLDQAASPGVFRVLWDGRDEAGRPAASGVYYCELSVGPIRLRRALTLLR